jgi:hypothetical protein
MHALAMEAESTNSARLYRRPRERDPAPLPRPYVPVADSYEPHSIAVDAAQVARRAERDEVPRLVASAEQSRVDVVRVQADRDAPIRRSSPASSTSGFTAGSKSSQSSPLWSALPCPS